MHTTATSSKDHFNTKTKFISKWKLLQSCFLDGYTRGKECIYIIYPLASWSVCSPPSKATTLLYKASLDKFHVLKLIDKISAVSANSLRNLLSGHFTQTSLPKEVCTSAGILKWFLQNIPGPVSSKWIQDEYPSFLFDSCRCQIPQQETLMHRRNHTWL